ncbi:hypothetical protein HG537_0F01040 [Torulaspora globosa]|uniref:Uncharacterized protein n=1 Tax=Torulaspora globosa TaxID=48254 RepID=A0A7H9HVN7_9SACH|nr:hypothetical protein HG537_0F01040 [Torulaspora sp. CBS 2947]
MQLNAMTMERLPLGEFSSSRVNKLGRSQPLKRTRLPSIKTLINCTAELAQSDCSVGKRDLTRVSQKLRVRLQLAYFKLKINQTNTKFKDLKRQFELNDHGKKRRKLVVSQGNYKTPLKSHRVHHTTESTDNFLQFHDRTTPINSSRCIATQNTPMSVNAAKSLLHLFTSSQQ